MRFAGLLEHELARLLTRGRLYLLILAMAAIGIAAIVSDSHTRVVGSAGAMTPSAPILFLGMLDQMSFLFIIWPMAVGGTLAEDLESGFASLLVTRVGSRSAWLGSKLAAAFVVALSAFTAIAAVWLGTALVLAPWDLRGLTDIITFGDGVAARHPLLLALFVIVVLALAATTVAMLSALLGAITRSPVMSQFGASVAYLLCMLGLPQRINPLTRASMLSFIAPWMTPASTALYWSATLSLLVLGTFMVIRWKETR